MASLFDTRSILGLLLTALLAACGGADTTPDSPPAESPAESAEGAEYGVKEGGEVEESGQDGEEPLPQPGAAGAPADVAAPPADAVTTESGLAYKVLREGSGERTPETTDVVRVHYVGWTTDGEQFDSSYDRGKPAEFPLDKVIPGWTEGVSMMTEGEIRRLWIPEDLAYRGQAGRPAGMLVFDVELLEIM